MKWDACSIMAAMDGGRLKHRCCDFDTYSSHLNPLTASTFTLIHGGHVAWRTCR